VRRRDMIERGDRGYYGWEALMEKLQRVKRATGTAVSAAEPVFPLVFSDIIFNKILRHKP
jgi:hypothetical protein